MNSSDGNGKSAADLARLIVPVVVVIGLAAAWQLTPLGDLAPEVQDAIAELRGTPAAPFIVVGAFVLGGLLVVPVSLLIVAVAATFGPLKGGLYALVGALASAAVVFLIGHAVGRQSLDRVLGERARRVADRLGRHGVLAVALVRNIPVAPYSVVNLVAGASPIRFRDFLLGTLIGLLPGVVGLSLIGSGLGRFLQEPDARSLITVAVLVVVVAVLGAVAARWLLKRQSP